MNTFLEEEWQLLCAAGAAQTVWEYVSLYMQLCPMCVGRLCALIV